jgi:hypothetical protein
VNGDLFAEQMICTDAKKGILACVFYEGIGHEWIAKDLLFTAHKEGVVRVCIGLALLTLDLEPICSKREFVQGITVAVESGT